MTVITKHQAAKGLAKKAKKREPSSETSGAYMLVTHYRKQNIRLTHAILRGQTLQYRLGKLKVPYTSFVFRDRQSHGVELTDDVIMLDERGRRIPTPEYAKVSIDKLPRFQKG